MPYVDDFVFGMCPRWGI
jgi:hypothetical protein